MNASAWLLIALFLAVAAVDWMAVHLGSKRLEYVAKPGCMVFLIAAAVAIDPIDAAARWALLAALVASVAGDVFLMLPGRQPGSAGPNLFVAGLASFLLAHLFYVGGFLLVGVEAGELWTAALPLVAAVFVGWRVVASVRASSEPELAAPVAGYITVISLMLLVAFGTGNPWARAGALLFVISDSLIAVGRFMKVTRWGPMAVIVTYHLAQAALVVSFT